MAVASKPTRLAADEFAIRFGDVSFCELERGEVVRLSPGGMDHGRPCARVTYLLEAWAGRTGLGRVYGNELGLVTRHDPDSVRGADVAYLSYARLPESETPMGYCPVPPELVVEVIGKGQGWKKLVEKAGEYLNMGVDRVWILDPKNMSLHIFRSDSEPLRLTSLEIVQDETILPGFSCLVGELFERRRG